MKRALIVWPCLLALCVALPANAAKLYKWVDRDGNVSYQDSPPPDHARNVEQKEMGRGAQVDTDDPALEEAVSRAPVVFYSLPTCAPCDMVRSHLEKRGVPFTEKNAESNVDIQQEVIRKAGSLRVPTVSIGEQVISEYSQAWIDTELDRAGYPRPGAGRSQEGQEAQ